MPYHIFLRILEQREVASIRVTTEAEDIGPLAGEHLPAIYNQLSALRVQPGGPPFIRYHQIETPPFDVEFGFPLPAPGALAEAPGQIALSSLPGGPVAATWHVGPYETAVHAAGALRNYIRAQGWSEAGPPWDVYWTNPRLEPNPARWKTEVLWPIRLHGAAPAP